MDIYELDSELILLDLFNFKLEKTTTFNKFNILDEFNNTIGFIEKKILSTTNSNPVLAIYTEIITNDILYKNTREINNYDINKYSYNIAKRNNDGSLSYIYLNLGKNKEISFIHNNKKAVFSIKNNELYLNFRGTTKNYNYEEKLIINSSNEEKNKHYQYTIDFCDKKNNLDDIKTKTTLSIKGHELYRYFSYSKGEITKPTFRLNTRKIACGKMIENDYYEINNSKLKDLIITHNDSLEMFSHFRYLIENILPFKKEIISYMFENQNLPSEFLMFVSNNSRNYLKTLKPETKF